MCTWVCLGGRSVNLKTKLTAPSNQPDSEAWKDSAWHSWKFVIRLKWTISQSKLPNSPSSVCCALMIVIVNFISRSCYILWVLCLYVCTSLCLCVSGPLWSPIIPNLTDLLQRQPLMCAESLSGILDTVSIIFIFYSLIGNPLFCFQANTHTYARIAQQDRWLLCYESVYTFRCVFTSSLFCNFTSLSSFNPILILCKPSNLWP